MKDFVEKLIGVLLLLGIIFGLFAVVVGPIEMFKKAGAETWPSRRAVITRSTLRSVSGSGLGPKRQLFWRAEICGGYQDDGQPFCVSRIRYGASQIGKAASLETVARYPAGREVDIYHDPGNPQETVLEARSSWPSWPRS